jgi:hypothetical protein
MGILKQNFVSSILLTMYVGLNICLQIANKYSLFYIDEMDELTLFKTRI